MRAALAIVAAAVLSTAPAFGQDNGVEGLYLGVGLGDFSTGIDDISDVDEANQHLNLRAEYEVVEIDGLEDPNAVWVTAAWRF